MVELLCDSKRNERSFVCAVWPTLCIVCVPKYANRVWNDKLYDVDGWMMLLMSIRDEGCGSFWFLYCSGLPLYRKTGKMITLFLVYIQEQKNINSRMIIVLGSLPWILLSLWSQDCLKFGLVSVVLQPIYSHCKWLCTFSKPYT